MRTLIFDQYGLISSGYVFSNVSSYFSSDYINELILDLQRYIENHLNETTEEIHNYWIIKYKQSSYPRHLSLYNNEFQKQYDYNDKEISKKIIHELAEIGSIITLFNLYKSVIKDIVETSNNIIQREIFDSMAFCKVINENRVYLNDIEITKHHLIQHYATTLQNSIALKIEIASLLRELLDIILQDIFFLDDSSLKKFISSREKPKTLSDEATIDGLTELVNHLPENIFADQNKGKCHNIIGQMISKRNAALK